MLDILHLFDCLTETEHAAQMEQLQDMEGERVNLLVADASFGYSSIIPKLERVIPNAAATNQRAAASADERWRLHACVRIMLLVHYTHSRLSRPTHGRKDVMNRARIFLSLLLGLVVIPLILAQHDKPTIAMFTFGPDVNEASEFGVLDVLYLYDYLSDEEYSELRSSLSQGLHDLEGERVNLMFSDAAWDYASIIPMLEAALDKGADVLITETTPVSQAAVNLTSQMEDPPQVIFMSVFNPYAAGLADAPCVKPAHVSGTERVIDYETMLSLVTLQNPDTQKIGTVYASDSAAGAYGAEQIATFGEDLGLTVEDTAVVDMGDVALAVESVIGKGAQALVLTADLLTSEALPIIVGIAEDNSVPIYHPNAVYFATDATVVAGSIATYGPGLNAGHMLVGTLNGSIDLATTGVNAVSGLTIAVNVDRALENGIAVPQQLLEMADFTLQDGGLAISPKGMTNFQFLGEMSMMALLYPQMAAESELAAPEMLTMLTQMAFPDPKAQHDAFLESLQCTPEMIAEQQAELDAAAG